MNKNESLAVNRRIPVYLVDSSGAGVAGITWTNPPASGEVRISQAGAASVNASGTMGVDETGKYYYEATQSETNFDGLYFILDVTAKGSARRFVYAEPMVLPISTISTSSVAAAVWDVARSGHVTSGTFGEGISNIQSSLDIVTGLLKENSMVDNTTFTGSNMTAARIRVFANKTAAQAATIGSSNGTDGETQRYLVTATYAGSNLSSYTLVKDL